MKDEESKNPSAVQSIHPSSLITHPSVFVGGNIGDPLINYVDDMTADDFAILEISSFQLEQMTISPNIAAILNITPNHLDRHGTMEAYTNAKARILEFQTEKDTAILGHDDKGAWNLRNKVKGKLLTFSLNDLDQGLNGAYLHDGLLNLRDGNAYLPLILREKIKLPGDHNVANVLAAFTIGHAAGFKLDDMLEAVEEFRGVPHRLELVRELHGVRWYNGSIATAPERSMADIHAFDEPIVLMLGGRDKDLPWDGIAKLIHKRVDHVVLFGEAAELIQKAISAAGEARSVDLRRAKILKRQSPSPRKLPAQETSSCFHQAARVMTSSRILLREERPLENGYWNLRKRTTLRLTLFTRIRHAIAGCHRSVDRVWACHAVLCFMGFFSRRVRQRNAHVQSSSHVVWAWYSDRGYPRVL